MSTIPAAAALIGVWIAGGNERKRQAVLLRTQALTAQRDLIVRAVLAGQDWADLQTGWIAMLAKADRSTLHELADTETAGRIKRALTELRHSLTSARIYVADDDIRQVVTTLSSHLARHREDVMGPIHTNYPNNIEQVAYAIGETAKFQKTIRDLEELAVERLRSA